MTKVRDRIGVRLRVNTAASLRDSRQSHKHAGTDVVRGLGLVQSWGTTLKGRTTEILRPTVVRGFSLVQKARPRWCML